MAEIKPITGSEIQKIFVKVPTKESLGFAAGTVNGFAGEWPAQAYSSAYNSVIFIEDTHDIWAQGKFYGGLSAEQEADLTYILAGLGSEIKTTKDLVNSIIGIHGTEGPEIGTSRIGVIDAIDVIPTEHTGDGFSYYTYDFTYSYSYVEVYNNPEASADNQSTLSVIPIATSISINRDETSGNSVISLSYTYSEINAANISASPIKGDADASDDSAYQISGATIQEQLEELVSEINDIHTAQEGGLTDANSITTTDASYFFSYIAISATGELTYTESKLTAANISYSDSNVNAALTDLYAKINATRDNYLSAVNRVHLSSTDAAEVDNGTNDSSVQLTNTGNLTDPLYIEFIVAKKTAEEEDPDAAPTEYTYLYVKAADLLNDYSGAISSGTITGTSTTYETSVAIDNDNKIYTYITSLSVPSSDVSFTPGNDASYTAGATTTEGAIQALDTNIQTAYSSLDQRIQALDGATVKTVAGGDNISVSANDGTYTVSAYFTYDFSTDTTGYVKTGAAQTYTDIVGYLNAGIADAHTDAIATSEEYTNTTIATYMMWHTVGETTNP